MGTIAGKVYLQVPNTDREGEITWVYCQGKLYLKRATEPFGNLHIYDPETLTRVADAKLFVADLPNVQTSTFEQMNKNYPLLSDKENLYIICAHIAKKKRVVKSTLKNEYELLQTKKLADKTAGLDIVGTDTAQIKAEALRRAKNEK